MLGIGLPVEIRGHGGEAAKARLAFDQVALRLPVRGAHRRFLELARERRREPLDVLFHHIVAGAGFHRLHGDFLADGAGDEDEGDVQARGLVQPQRFEAGKARYSVIREERVPAAARERRLQRVGAVDALIRGVEAIVAQCPQCKAGVVFGVLDDEDLDRLVHAVVPSGGG